MASAVAAAAVIASKASQKSGDAVMATEVLLPPVEMTIKHGVEKVCIGRSARLAYPKRTRASIGEPM